MGNRSLFHRAVDTLVRTGLRHAPISGMTESAALWWGYRYLPPSGEVRLRSGAVMHVTPTDYLQMLLYYTGTFEAHCLRILGRVLHPGSVFVDVGANIGLYTVEAGRLVGGQGTVVSVEAAPPHIGALERNIRLNRLANVQVIPHAAGAEIGSATLSLAPGENLGMFTLGSVESDAAHRVRVEPLDVMLGERGIARVDLIKMDIEGAELEALRGARDVLTRDHPPILIELNDKALARCSASSGEVKALLADLGYRGWVVGRTGSSRIDTVSTHPCDECLFLHEGDMARAAGLGLSS
jgi:FkbM family methyltransferase